MTYDEILWKIPYKAILISMLSSRPLPKDKAQEKKKEAVQGRPGLGSLIRKTGYKGVKK